MIGTIVNTCTIIAGTLVGAFLHRGIKEKYKDMLYTGLGLASLAIGLNATVQNLPKSQYPVLFIVAIAVGGVLGTWLDIDGRFKRIVNRTPTTPTTPTPNPSRGEGSLNTLTTDNTTSNANQAPLPSGGAGGGYRESGSLADGLSTAILLYCIGPLSMLGPVISALQGDNTFLFTNATLDFVSATIFASTYGLGMILAAPVLFCWQGMFYLVAKISSEAVSDALMSELLIVGGLLITASGLSLLKLKDCKTLNLLPALLVPVLWFLIKALW
ncbi:MAG: DUF554 domain-containing protein [Prevotella sp.]|nr:DUF554 domain-containing protein [Prevotella sp.]